MSIARRHSQRAAGHDRRAALHVLEQNMRDCAKEYGVSASRIAYASTVLDYAPGEYPTGLDSDTEACDPAGGDCGPRAVLGNPADRDRYIGVSRG
ncbi:MAG: hypothetical protein ACRDTH_15610 [Pseudonocardiaceae bacterium]